MEIFLVVPLCITSVLFIAGCKGESRPSPEKPSVQWVNDVKSNVVGTNYTSSLSSTDMDGDGDTDILTISDAGNTIIWYENNGAAVASFSDHVVSSAEDRVYSVYAVDIDNDGDMDVVSVSGPLPSSEGPSADHTISWHENDGAAAPSFIKHVMVDNIWSVRSIATDDVDGDGDMDVLSLAFDFGVISLYENDGAIAPDFTEQVISSTTDGPTSVYTVDVDGDGDIDVLAASFYGVSWYENNGAAKPSFSKKIIGNTADINESIYVYAADVDNDGDMDVLSASNNNGPVVWYENDGDLNPLFTTHNNVTGQYAFSSAYSAYLNDDDQSNVFSYSKDGKSFSWYSIADQYQVAVSTTASFSMAATDTDGNSLEYRINADLSAAPDMDYFTIDISTGELVFSGATTLVPASDANGDNVYEVVVTVTNGATTLHRKVAVNVHN